MTNKSQWLMILKRALRNITIVIACAIQLMILCLCLIAFTSTMELFPWYEPLTMGAYFFLMYITPIQFILTLIIPTLHNLKLIPKTIRIVSYFHLGILILAIFAAVNIKLFYIFSFINAILECLLIGLFIYSSIKGLIIKNKQSSLLK